MSDNAVRFRLPRRVLDEGLDGVLAAGARAGGAGRRVWAEGLDGVLIGWSRGGRRIDVDALDGVGRLRARRVAPTRPAVVPPRPLAAQLQEAVVEHLPTERFEVPAPLAATFTSEVDWMPTERMPTPAEVEYQPTRAFGSARPAPAVAAPSVARPAPVPPAATVQRWNVGWALALATIGAASVAAVVVGVATYLVADAWLKVAAEAPVAAVDPPTPAATEAPPAEPSDEGLAPVAVAEPVIEARFAPDSPPKVDPAEIVTVSYAFNEVESEQAVDLAVTYALNCPGTVEVTGHTCAMGPPDVNDAIGLTRAHDVRYRLISAGVPRDHVEVFTAGSREPVGDNTTEEGRRLNRRVTVFCRTLTVP